MLSPNHRAFTLRSGPSSRKKRYPSGVPMSIDGRPSVVGTRRGCPKPE
jgi:hypothetical protein